MPPGASPPPAWLTRRASRAGWVALATWVGHVGSGLCPDPEPRAPPRSGGSRLSCGEDVQRSFVIYTARLRAAIVSTLHTRSTRDLLLPTLSSAGSVVGAHTAGLDRQSDAIWRLQSVTAASRAPPIIRSIHP